MKTPYVIMKRSAMSQHSKVSILSNEIVRRLSNINHKMIPTKEIEEVVEVFIGEMKTSGYERAETKEIVVSGITGWQRKMKRREEEGRIYRSARSTLSIRCRKKLLEKTSWYKAKRKREDEEMGERKKRKKLWKGKENNGEKREDPNQGKAKAVLFAPYTHHSTLARDLRQAELKLEELTGYKLKVVERAGMRLEDLLCKADPWQGKDCCREACLLCKTKEKTGKNKSQDCTKRSLVYEIWCLDCESKEEDRIKAAAGDDEKLLEELKKTKKLYKYVGESSRSIYERAMEHSNALTSLSSGSSMLRHHLDQHEGEELDPGKFGVRVLQYTRTSFERQILESVKIQENNNHFLLNSKSEYNRCAIPRLTTKIGETAYKRWKKEEKEDLVKEALIETKIRYLRKNINKVRRTEDEQPTQPFSKKRRTENGGDGRKLIQVDIREAMEKRKNEGQTVAGENENLPEGWKDDEENIEKAITVGD